jgi:HAD superfamily hydrolase (TIGR01509 family)
MLPKALFIDLDGVVRRWPPIDAIVERRFGLAPGSVHAAAFAPHVLMPAITGAVSDDEWRDNVASALGERYGLQLARAAVAAWSEHPGEVDAATMSIVDRCASHVKVLLLTNATSRLPDDLAALGLTNRFHAVVNSSVLGVAKPEAAIFLAALQRAAVAPAHALFVDDSRANVAAATSLGMTSHRFTDHSKLWAFLRAQGVLAGDGT